MRKRLKQLSDNQFNFLFSLLVAIIPTLMTNPIVLILLNQLMPIIGVI